MKTAYTPTCSSCSSSSPKPGLLSRLLKLVPAGPPLWPAGSFIRAGKGLLSFLACNYGGFLLILQRINKKYHLTYYDEPHEKIKDQLISLISLVAVKLF
jgi:hypothetical protein